MERTRIWLKELVDDFEASRLITEIAAGLLHWNVGKMHLNWPHHRTGMVGLFCVQHHQPK